MSTAFELSSNKQIAQSVIETRSIPENGASSGHSRTNKKQISRKDVHNAKASEPIARAVESTRGEVSPMSPGQWAWRLGLAISHGLKGVGKYQTSTAGPAQIGISELVAYVTAEYNRNSQKAPKSEAEVVKELRRQVAGKECCEDLFPYIGQKLEFDKIDPKSIRTVREAAMDRLRASGESTAEFENGSQDGTIGLFLYAWDWSQSTDQDDDDSSNEILERIAIQGKRLQDLNV